MTLLPGLDGKRMVTRVKGRQALEQRLMRIVIALHRYGQHRARTVEEMKWTAKLLDRLEAALAEARKDNEVR